MDDLRQSSIGNVFHKNFMVNSNQDCRNVFGLAWYPTFCGQPFHNLFRQQVRRLREICDSVSGSMYYLSVIFFFFLLQKLSLPQTCFFFSPPPPLVVMNPPENCLLRKNERMAHRARRTGRAGCSWRSAPEKKKYSQSGQF
jgi:hypothetical protein